MATTFPSKTEKRLCFLARQATTRMTEGDSKMASFFQSGINARDKERDDSEERVEGDGEGKCRRDDEDTCRGAEKQKERDGESENKAPSPCSGVWRQREKLEPRGEREGGKKKKKKKGVERERAV